MPLESLDARVRGEYREMPGLHLTCAQACRLWQLDAIECEYESTIAASNADAPGHTSRRLLSTECLSPHNSLALSDDDELIGVDAVDFLGTAVWPADGQLRRCRSAQPEMQTAIVGGIET